KYKSKKVANPVPPTAVTKSSARQAVTVISHKISVPGLKKFPTAIEDAGNNPLLDNDDAVSPVPRSPKKKAKKVHVPSTSEEEDVGDGEIVDDDVEEEPALADIKGKGKQPATPVSRLTVRMMESGLDSSKKGKLAAALIEALTPRPLPPSDEDMLFADADLRRRVSPSLKDTYGGLPIVLRYPTHDTCWDTWGTASLDVMVHATSIRREPERMKAIARVVSTPCLSPMIYNPARCDWNNFRTTVRENGPYKEAQYFVTADPYDTP
ncbi:hypothetical protein BDW22DRAFT_1433775, partial [Trametopsis cervina]